MHGCSLQRRESRHAPVHHSAGKAGTQPLIAAQGEREHPDQVLDGPVLGPHACAQPDTLASAVLLPTLYRYLNMLSACLVHSGLLDDLQQHRNGEALMATGCLEHCTREARTWIARRRSDAVNMPLLHRLCSVPTHQSSSSVHASAMCIQNVVQSRGAGHF